MSDTPRTDEFYWRETGANPVGRSAMEWSMFARTLERELSEARKHISDANRGAEVNAKVNQCLVRELAEARRQVEGMAKLLSPMTDCGRHMVQDGMFWIGSSEQWVAQVRNALNANSKPATAGEG